MKRWIPAIVASLLINFILFSGVALYMTLFKAEPEVKPEPLTLTFVEDQGGTSGGAPQVAAPKPEKVDITAPPTPEQIQEIKDGVPIEKIDNPNPTPNPVATPAPTNAPVNTNATGTNATGGNEANPNGNPNVKGGSDVPPEKPPGESRRPIPISVSEPTLPKSSLANADWPGGRAVVAYTIGTDGSMVSVDLIESSGDSAADAAALEAAWSWHFEPALDNGEPVQYSGTKGIRIHING